MAEPSKGGIKKDGQTRGGTANGRKYVKTDRKGGDAQRKDAQKETNSRGAKAKVQAGSGKGGALEKSAPRTPPSGGKSVPAVRTAPGTQVGGLAGKIAPRNPNTVAPAGPRPGAPAGPQGYTQSYGQPAEGMRDVGSGRSQGAMNPRSYGTTAQTAPGTQGQLPAPQGQGGMSAGGRAPLSSGGGESGLMKSILGVIGRYAPVAGAVASVMQPSPTNQGEAEWLAQGKPNPITPPSSTASSGGAVAGSPLDRPVAQVNPERAVQRVAVAPSDDMSMGRSTGPRNAQTAPSNRSSGLPTKAAPSASRKAPSGSPQSRPSGLSVNDKVAQLVAKGFSREDAMKLATAQGGKVNAPAGYKKGGLVKVNGAGDVKLKEPGKPRMPKMPAVGKAGTDGVVKAVIAKAKKPLKKAK